jgi:hypothetical protein
MKEGTTLGARAQSAIQRAAVLYKPRLATFLLVFTLLATSFCHQTVITQNIKPVTCSAAH